MSSSGIEPANFRLVSLCLNYATSWPPEITRELPTDKRREFRKHFRKKKGEHTRMLRYRSSQSLVSAGTYMVIEI
jgi:hypothetical protein